MAELTSKLTREDIETLIEAMGDWEMLGNQEFHLLQMIKGAPMPPEDHEDHEAYDIMSQIKEHYKKRERDINASRVIRQERAVLLKAKLMLARIDIGSSQLFDLALNVDTENPQKKAPEASPAAKAQQDESLALAEFFIRDLGVWDHYQRFLQERNAGG